MWFVVMLSFLQCTCSGATVYYSVILQCGHGHGSVHAVVL